MPQCTNFLNIVLLTGCFGNIISYGTVCMSASAIAGGATFSLLLQITIWKSFNESESSVMLPPYGTNFPL